MKITGEEYIDNIINDLLKDTEIHSVFMYSYPEIFNKVIDRINNPEKYEHLWIDIKPDKIAMMNRLKEEIIETKDVCLTGRITSLVNVLSGFYKDINIHINTMDQINTRINISLDRTINKPILSRIIDIRNSLRELNMSDEKIKEWISYINAVQYAGLNDFLNSPQFSM